MTDDADATTGGTYTLLLELDEPAAVGIGRLGEREFPAGHYAYTGSALGPGGFARVDRHREVATGERDVRQWHVDSLLGLEAATVVAAIRSPGVAAECAIARGVHADPVPGFGATDCDCDSHLAQAADREALYRAAWAAHEAVGDGERPRQAATDG